MAHTSIVQITPGLRIASLLVIERSSFAGSYRHGLGWSLFERETTGPLDGLYLPDCPSLFTSQQEEHFCLWVGFWLGMIHGGVLLQNGSLAPGVTSLIKLHDRQVSRGYYAGRHYYFTEVETDEQRMTTDTHVLEQCRTLAAEYGTYQDGEGTLLYTVGGMLGRLSSVLFPWTAEEHARMEQVSLHILGYIEPLRPGCLAYQYQMSLQPA